MLEKTNRTEPIDTVAREPWDAVFPTDAAEDLLLAGESGEAFEVLAGNMRSGLVLLCDHARNTIPPEFDNLGMPVDQLERHIAYDIGAEAVTRAMAAQLGVPAILSKFSRLVIDPNRGLDDPTLVMRLSDGAVVPGNRHVGPVEKAERIERFHAPYHNAIRRVLAAFQAARKVPVLLSLHSFTPSWKGIGRPWHVTVLWDRDPRLVRPLLVELAKIPGAIVGENEPYTGELTNDCMNTHGTRNGFPHALIEIRQDLIASSGGQQDWADHLCAAVARVFQDAATRAAMTTVLNSEEDNNG